jgi:hypothetical protein
MEATTKPAPSAWIDVPAIVALGLFLVGLALTLGKAGLAGAAPDIAFALGFLTLAWGWRVHRRAAPASS